MAKTALILGVGGQDGSYLAELLLSKGYVVHGLYRRSSVDNLWRIAGIRGKLVLHLGDLSDHGSIHRTIAEVFPDELYNLADQDEVAASRQTVGYSLDVTCAAVGRILDSVHRLNRDAKARQPGPVSRVPQVRVFQPVSATMFGGSPAPQDENSPLDPRSPYAVAKLGAYHLCRFYRREYGLHVSTGIMFNHDSPRRGPNYLLQRICRQAVQVHFGSREKVDLWGDPDLRVDVGYAGDYVEAMHRILTDPDPDDYCVATGGDWSVRDVAVRALVSAGFLRENCDDRIGWKDAPDGRPQPTLIGDAGKIGRRLGWSPTLTLPELIDAIYRHHETEARRG